MHCSLGCGKIRDVDSTAKTVCHIKQMGGDNLCKVTLVWVTKPLPRKALYSACSWLPVSTFASATNSIIYVYVMMTEKLICDDASLISNFDIFG